MARVRDMLCDVCGKPASCIGKYDADAYSPACDECCGHGNEDGHCIRCTENDQCANCDDGRSCAAAELLLRPADIDEDDTPPYHE